jgi:putative FmdB family regulatory protein
MPFYAYKCESCGFAKDVLQKMSDAQLTVCPSCGADAFRKQVTAAGFQLKGSGWYVTDFRSGSGGGKEAAKEGGGKESGDTAAAPAAPAAAGKSDASSAPSPAPAPAPSPAPSGGGSSSGGGGSGD